jgi:hypothetical protein
MTTTDRPTTVAEAPFNTIALRAIALSDPKDTARTGALSAMALLAADALDALAATVARVEALRDEWARDDTEHLATFGQHLPASLSTLEFMLRAALSEPTGAHLRVLPRERYDAVLDSGPTEPTEGES